MRSQRSLLILQRRATRAKTKRRKQGNTFRSYLLGGRLTLSASRQRANFREFLRTVEDGDVPQENFNVSGTEIEILGWAKCIQIREVRRWLNTGLQTHLKVSRYAVKKRGVNFTLLRIILCLAKYSNIQSRIYPPTKSGKREEIKSSCQESVHKRSQSVTYKKIHFFLKVNSRMKKDRYEKLRLEKTYSITADDDS